MNNGRTVYMNGRFVPETEARVSVFDSALVWGDMVFETTRSFGHRPFKLREHLERLNASMIASDIDCGMTLDELEEATDELVRRNSPLYPADVDFTIVHNVSPGVFALYADVAPEAGQPTVAIHTWPLIPYIGPMADWFDTGVNAHVPRQHAIPGRLLDPKVKSRSPMHYRMALNEAQQRGDDTWAVLVDEDGYLFLSVGDRQVPPRGDLAAHPAQDLSNHHGVIVRLHDDGSVPGDNPFVGREGARSEIWSYGHRNPQGLAIHPETGALWLTEHGPRGGDEVNVSTPGGNYGWPVIGYGVNYRGGTAIHASTHAEGMEQPLHYWVPSIGVSGLTFYTGEKFPEWRGDLFAGGLSGRNIDRLTIEDGRVVERETIFRGMGRVRDVREGPDGYIYVALEARGGGKTPIVRLEPAR